MSALRLRRLATFDAFPKIDSHYTAPTTSGALTSFITSILIVVLFLSEFAEYRRLHVTYEFLVDSSAPINQDLGWMGAQLLQGLGIQVINDQQINMGQLNVNLDLTVAMECDYLAIDVLDAGGLRLNVKEQLKTEPAPFHTKGVEYYKPRPSISESESVHNIINDARSSISPTSKTADPSQPANGCRIQGAFKVNKVIGNIHLTATGHGFFGTHAPHDVFNFTHRFDKLSFGVDYPGLINPLSKVYQLSDSNFAMFQYFVNIVPTIYIDASSDILLTNQYAVTDYNRVIDHDHGSHGLPGIFIKYDVEPLSVRIHEMRTPFLTFVTRICGIIGGVFVSAGILHSVFRNVIELIVGSKGGRQSQGAETSRGRSTYSKVVERKRKVAI